MKKFQYNIRLPENIASKWKEQAMNLGITDSAYIEQLFTKLFEDKSLLFDKKEVFGYETMIKPNDEEKFKIKRLSTVEEETNKFVIRTVLNTNADWNSPMMNYRLKLCKDFIDNQISIVSKLNGDVLLINNLVSLKEILDKKDEQTFLSKIMDERNVKLALYWLSKKYNKDYQKLENYIFGKTKNLVEVNVISKVEQK